MSDRPPRYLPPDNIPGRTLELESRINQAFAAMASQPAGQLCLDYLQTITMNMVLGPVATDAQLRHLEGQRDLFRIIKARIDDGRNRRPDFSESEPRPRAVPYP